MINRLSWLNVRDRGAFARLTGVLFLVYLATGLWSPLLAVYTRSLGADAAQIGLVFATFQATSLAPPLNKVSNMLSFAQRLGKLAAGPFDPQALTYPWRHRDP